MGLIEGKDESFAAAVGEHELIRMGSSLKACVVAEGGADLCQDSAQLPVGILPPRTLSYQAPEE